MIPAFPFEPLRVPCERADLVNAFGLRMSSEQPSVVECLLVGFVHHNAQWNHACASCFTVGTEICFFVSVLPLSTVPLNPGSEGRGAACRPVGYRCRQAEPPRREQAR